MNNISELGRIRAYRAIERLEKFLTTSPDSWSAKSWKMLTGIKLTEMEKFNQATFFALWYEKPELVKELLPLADVSWIVDMAERAENQKVVSHLCLALPIDQATEIAARLPELIIPEVKARIDKQQLEAKLPGPLGTDKTNFRM